MELTTISAVILYLTIRSVQSAIISAERIEVMQRTAILRSYNERFHVSNVTFACNETNNAEMRTMIQGLLNKDKVSIRRVQKLEEEDMQHLLNYKGGTFIPEYMATDTRSARNRFPDAKIMRFKWNSIHNIEESKRRWKHSKPYSGNNILGDIWSKNIQAVGKRRKRRQIDEKLLLPNDSGNTRVDESCSDAGEPSIFDPNYLHLCTLCSAKRLLPQDRYPSVINEVYCKSSDNGCLDGGNGKCIETIFNVHILKRRDDICRLCVKDSEPLAVNEWETYIEPISVGCECMLEKTSAYKEQWFSAGKSESSPWLG